MKECRFVIATSNNCSDRLRENRVLGNTGSEVVLERHNVQTPSFISRAMRLVERGI